MNRRAFVTGSAAACLAAWAGLTSKPVQVEGPSDPRTLHGVWRYRSLTALIAGIVRVYGRSRVCTSRGFEYGDMRIDIDQDERGIWVAQFYEVA